MAQVFTLPDGRKLDYLLSGAADGFPLVFIHGTPGAYPADPDLRTACEKKGIKLITFSRAGYGGSSRHRGRRVVDVVADIHALLEHLRVKTCIVAGRSGGGPHSLACGARLPGCVAALCICGVAPFNAEGLDFLDGCGEDNVLEFNAALEGEEALTAFCNAARPGILAADAVGLVQELSSVLPEVDKKVITESESVGEDLVRTFREALKQHVDGWVDDDLAFVEPWGFELSEIKVPVMVWQGDEDKMVPFAHGKWLAAHLPQDQLKEHLVQGEGHVSIAHNYLDAMLDEVLAAAGR